MECYEVAIYTTDRERDNLDRSLYRFMYFGQYKCMHTALVTNDDYLNPVFNLA